MLTDRQNKFLNMIQLLSLSNTITSEEKKYLLQALNEIQAEKNFKDAINSLNLALKALDFGKLQEGGLTPQVKKLFLQLKEAYGEPESWDKQNAPKWQEDSQKDMIYTRWGWRKESDLRKPQTTTSGIISMIIILIIISLILMSLYFLKKGSMP